MLEFRGVSIAYRGPNGPLVAVEGASALFREGEIGALVGPSGCGKTSLVRAAAGLLRPMAGSVLVEGRELSGTRARTAVIFQDYGLLPWKTVEGNVALPLELRGLGRKERRARVQPLLEELGLAGFARYYPARLSGGMRQRVAIARALAAEPDLLLMDEPFSSLDALTREGLQESLLSVVAGRRLSVVIVTHSIEEAAFLARRTYVMGGRAPGRITALVEAPRADLGTTEAEFRGAEFRGSAHYFELCVAIRRALENAKGAAR